MILPDGVRNYLTKFVDDKWMRENRFFSTSGLEGSVGDILKVKGNQLITLEQTAQCQEAIKLMREKNFSQIPITSKGILSGMIYEKDLLGFLLSGQHAALDSEISSVMSRQFSTVTVETPLTTLQDLLLNAGSAVVIAGDRTPQQILTHIDLVEWIADRRRPSSAKRPS